jgi:hypothetical protein
MTDRADELAELLLGCAWLRDVLDAVDELVLPDAWVGAGAVRDLVWDERFGAGFDPAAIKDVDVAFFDAADLTLARETAAEHTLARAMPSLDWDVKNQARVHLWYEERFGMPAEPLTSAIDGVSTWPETATAVAVRRRRGGVLEIAAPFGLDDLLDGVWRRNSRRVTDAEYRARLARKQPAIRWPGVRVVNDG